MSLCQCEDFDEIQKVADKQLCRKHMVLEMIRSYNLRKFTCDWVSHAYLWNGTFWRDTTKRCGAATAKWGSKSVFVLSFLRTLLQMLFRTYSIQFWKGSTQAGDMNSSDNTSGSWFDSAVKASLRIVRS